LTVVGLSALHLARLSAVVLEESHARGKLLANTVLHRAREVVRDSADPYGALASDPGLQAILEASLYDEGVTGAAIVDRSRMIVVHSDDELVGRILEPQVDFSALLNYGPLEQLGVIYARYGRTLEVRQPMVLDDKAFGTIYIGISTVLMRGVLQTALGPELMTAAVFFLIAVLVAGLLARRLLRPIHILRSGLSVLGRGGLGVALDLRNDNEFGKLDNSFNEVSRRVSAGRTLPSTLHAQATLGRLTAGLAHEVKNPLNAMAIHLELLRTKIRGAAVPDAVAVTGGTLGLTAESALPVLSETLQGALDHALVIELELRRLDEILQGFVKFTKPEDLDRHSILLSSLVDDLVPLIEPEASAHSVRVEVNCPPSVWINGDETTLGQALLNLALNACQAMPDGGTLRISGHRASRGLVEVRVEDTGVGIPPDELGRIFDLYFSTKDRGSGLGLSMVYRIVQLHDGEINVESTPEKGTVFHVLLPKAEQR
jgi:signal transduction histidine kinase